MNNELIFTKEISKECIDLIKKLLKKEKNSRLQTKDIFLHPWVVGFEKELFVGDISTSTSETSNFSLKRFKKHLKNV
jgi:serine/threonine protein kinase